jgi:DNA-binding CsgD family transcriptional regulator
VILGTVAHNTPLQLRLAVSTGTERSSLAPAEVVVRLIAAGNGKKQIAEQFGITEDTRKLAG